MKRWSRERVSGSLTEWGGWWERKVIEVNKDRSTDRHSERNRRKRERERERERE